MVVLRFRIRVMVRLGYYQLKTRRNKKLLYNGKDRELSHKKGITVMCVFVRICTIWKI